MQTPEPVAGSMATVTHDTQDLPHNTHVVRVRGVLLPMPQPDSLEDLPSPSVTPESSTLMRMANSLSRQQPGALLPALQTHACSLPGMACTLMSVLHGRSNH